MNCPSCGHLDTRVTDSRPSDLGKAIRRRRRCASCAQRFTTVELPITELGTRDKLRLAAYRRALGQVAALVEEALTDGA